MGAGSKHAEGKHGGHTKSDGECMIRGYGNKYQDQRFEAKKDSVKQESEDKDEPTARKKPRISEFNVGKETTAFNETPASARGIRQATVMPNNFCKNMQVLR